MDLSTLQNRFTEALFDPAALEGVLGDLCRQLNAPVIQLLSTSREFGFEASTFFGDLDHHLARFEVDYWSINPRVGAIPTMSLGQVLRDKDFITPEAIQRNAAYQELLIPCGTAHFGGVLLDKSPNSIIGLAAFNSRSRGPVDDEQVRHLESVAQLFAPVIGLARKLRVRDEQLVLNATTSGLAAVLDQHGRIRDTTAEFANLLAVGEARTSLNGRLLLRIGGRTHQPVAPIDPAMEATTFPVFDSNGEFAYLGRLMRVPGIGIHFWGASYVLTLTPSRGIMRIEADLLRIAYGLTNTEAEVARLIANGNSAPDIARQRGTTADTVRSMLKSIFEKTGCRRQSELAACLTRLASP